MESDNLSKNCHSQKIMVYFIVSNFFAIADLKIFSWCNVIQQIKKESPNDIFHHTNFFPIVDLKNFSWCNVIQQIKKCGLLQKKKKKSEIHGISLPFV